MPLIPVPTPTATHRTPWRGAVAGAAAALVFTAGLAVVARATRDGAGAPPPPVHIEERAVIRTGAANTEGSDRALDDGPPAAALDAGSLASSHVLTGPVDEPAAVPVVVAGPPVEAADVVAVAAPVVQECLTKALRFDPSLGGHVRLLVVVAAGHLSLSLPSSPSPVLASCTATAGASLAWPTAEGERHVVEAALALDGLRSTVRVESVELHASE